MPSRKSHASPCMFFICWVSKNSLRQSLWTWQHSLYFYFQASVYSSFWRLRCSSPSSSLSIPFSVSLSLKKILQQHKTNLSLCCFFHLELPEGSSFPSIPLSVLPLLFRKSTNSLSAMYFSVCLQKAHSFVEALFLCISHSLCVLRLARMFLCIPLHRSSLFNSKSSI